MSKRKYEFRARVADDVEALEAVVTGMYQDGFKLVGFCENSATGLYTALFRKILFK